MDNLELNKKLEQLAEQGVTFDLKGQDELVVRGKLSQLSGEWKVFLKSNKQAIISLIKTWRIAATQKMTVRPQGVPVPLSYSQQRLWLQHQIDGGSSHYHIPASLRLSGNLDTAAMQAAFSQIIERHESLRTSYVMKVDSGDPVQVIAKATEFHLPVEDVSSLDPEQQKQILEEFQQQDLSLNFDLSTDLMCRAQLFKLEEREFVLFVTMHHIASDGWSIAIMVNELCALYRAVVEGKQAPLPRLDIQYADYAYWQRNWLTGEELTRQLNFWEKQLSSLPVVHNLPLDNPRPERQTYHGRVYGSLINADITDALQEQCKALGASLFMGLHAVFSLLLARYSGERDIVIGTPIANREQSEIAGLIGFFINTLVLRSDLTEVLSFQELLGLSKSLLLDAYEHQHVPFEQIVERLQPERSFNHSPLFQVMLVLQNNQQAEASLPGVAMKPYGQARQVAKFDLTLTAVESDNGLALAWEYNTDLFAETSIARMASHFAILLEALLAAPHKNIWTLPLSASAEQQQLSLWNDNRVDFPTAGVEQLFSVQAEQHQQRIAVTFGDQSYTYNQLDKRANQLAQLLQSKGVKPGQLLGICQRRSLDLLVSLLAVQKAGAAYVPLDPAYPEDRIQYMLQDAELSVLLTDQSALDTQLFSEDSYATKHCQLINLSDAELLAEWEGTAPVQQATGDDLAYVIYTSGSTGRPKGVEVTRNNLSNFVCAMQQLLEPDEQDALLAVTSLSFDIAALELYLPLTCGAQVVLGDEQLAMDGQRLTEQLANGISIMQATPVTWKLLLASGWQPGAEQSFTALCGGEVFPVELANALLSHPISVWNLYGPTETTVWSSACELHKALINNTVPVGHAIANTQLYIFDEQGQTAPVGVAGELYIGGAGVARGYRGQAELTAQRFLDTSYGRLYRTGDLARYRDTGIIECLGRMDNQVKVRGYRIELGEIEHAITQQDTVVDAVVQANSRTGEDVLVAYVVARQEAIDANPQTDDNRGEKQQDFIRQLKDRLLLTLPGYMVPSLYVVLDTLPLTPNGKVDRKALPAPDMAQLTREYVAPETDMEHMLCAVWQDVLQTEKVGVLDNFFELGGHSLLVIRVIAQLQQKGILARVQDVFQTANLQALASALSLQGSTEQYRAPANLIPADCEALTPEMLPLVALSPAEIDIIVAKTPGGAANIQDIYPLGPLQEGIYFHHLMGQGQHNDPYVFPALLKVPGEQRLQTLLAGLQFIIDRHDVLRTLVLSDGLNQPCQVVCRKASLRVLEPQLPATQLSATQQEQTQDVLSQMQELSLPQNQWIDVSKAPMLQVQVAEDRDGTFYVLLQYHHLISDHEGLDIIRRELLAFFAGQGQTLPTSHHYREYVAQARHQATQNGAQQFFQDMLADIDEPAFPFGLSNIQNDGSQTLDCRQSVPQDIGQRIRTQAQRLRMSPASLFHAAWGLVLSTCSGRDQVVTGSVLSGRLQGTVGAEHMMGVFVNTLPLRMDIDGRDVAEFVQQVHQQLTTLLAYEQTSLAVAQSCSGIAAEQPLFSALLNYRHADNAPTLETDFNLRQQAKQRMGDIEFLGGAVRNNYPVTLSVDDYGQAGFGLTGLYDASVDAPRLMGYVQRALEALVTGLEAQEQGLSVVPVNRISLLAEAERLELISAADNTVMQMAEDTVHSLFEQQVALQPQATAVVCGPLRLSYAQLNENANRLAYYLRAQGVTADVPVALYMERSVSMLVGLLAVLKAGGCYLPLDTSWPLSRRETVLRDAGVSIVLSEKQLSEEALREEGRSKHIEADLSETEDTITRCICVDADAQLWCAESHSNPGFTVAGDDAAYIIYTSGSTGTPKGVVVEHRQLVNYVQGIHSRMNLAGMSFAHLSTVAADLGNTGLFGALCLGGQLHLVDADTAFDADALAATLAADPVDAIKIVPGHLQGLLSSAADALQILPRKLLILGGEACPLSLIEKVRDMSPELEIVNHYGPSETTVGVLTHKVTAADMVAGKVPLGKPLANSRVYVLDNAKNLLPVGVPGELYIGGAGVARGYLNRDALTASRFISDPFSDNPSARLYRTGDRVSRCEDGTLLFLGRTDAQLKVRGYRVEPGDIESCLLAQAGVGEAAVRLREEELSVQLVAYVVASEATGDSSQWLASLKGALVAQLPEYMVPQQFEVLDSLPLTANGKLDTKALDALPLSSLHNKAKRAPETATEQTLLDIWQQVLKRDDISTEDSFFALGGDSILSLQVIARARRAGYKLTPKQVFEHPQIAQLARVLEGNDEAVSVAVGGQQKAEAIPNPGVPEIVRMPDEAIIPLSYSQQRLWFLHQLEGANRAYNITAAIAISGDLNAERLAACFATLVRRHDSLRQYFPLEKGGPVVMEHCADDFAVSKKDFSALGEDEAHQAANSHLSEVTKYAFDISTEWLFQVDLLCLSAEQHWLVVNFHHIITDGWSLRLLLEEFSRLYQHSGADNSQVLPELTIGYRDYAWWQHHEGKVLYQQQMDYWLQKLAGAPALLALPTDWPRPARQTYNGAQFKGVLDAHQTAQLKVLAQQQDCTLYMVLMAVWQVLLSRYSGQRDICVGTPVANRHIAEVQPLLGFFTNTLVIRGDFSDNPCFDVFLQQIKTSILEAQAHQDAPFEQLVDRLNVVRHQSWSPLFQVMFSWGVSSVGESVSLSDIASLHFSAAGKAGASLLSASKFDIELNMRTTGDRVTGSLVYNTDLFQRSTIERMWQHFSGLLEALTAAPQSHVLTVPMLSSNEQQQLITWNDNQLDIPVVGVEKLFAVQADKHRERLAVTFEEQSFTYGQLDRRSGQLAQLLQNRGVQPGHLVGICQRRSLDLLTSILAVQKAGAAYVPLDPAYPAERIHYMLEDADLHLLLTDQAVLDSQLLNKGLLAELDCTIVNLDAPGLLAQCSMTAPEHKATDDDLAYVIYTSGSTGRPKGVEVTRGNLSNFICAMRELLQPEQQDALLAITSLSFDIAALELYLPLICGARVVLGDENLAMDGQRLMTRLSDSITIMQATPVTWKLLLASGWQAEDGGCFTALCGGEAFPVELAHALLSQPIEVWNMYGPTETTVWSSVCKLNEQSVTNTVSVGRPIANTRLYVLDEYRQAVPVGVVGELYIGGSGVARGYRGQPELTAECFVDSEYGRLYRTGDLARYRDTGAVECLGRIDNQVKVRGYRIELGEIEYALMQQEAVFDAVVQPNDRTGEPVLIAYIVPKEEAGNHYAPGKEQLNSDLHNKAKYIETPEQGFIQKLRKALSQSLPGYMMPSRFMLLDSLPLTPNGKVDRKALPAADMAQTAHAGVVPTTETEQILCDVWQAVLGVERVGILDNFFELGGHSLLVIRMIALLQERRIMAGVREVFEADTLKALASTLDEQRTRGQFSAPENRIPLECAAITPDMLPLAELSEGEIALITDQVSGGAANIQDIYPLGPLQKGIYFHHLMSQSQGSDPYVFTKLIKVSGQKQLDLLLAALQFIVDRHDVLRTMVLSEGLSQPLQVVCRKAQLPVTRLKLEGDEDAVLAHMQQLSMPEQQWLAVNKAPVLNLQVARVQGSDQQEKSLHYVLLQYHHLISDHEGLAIIQRELMAFFAGKEDVLPAPNPYREYVAQAQNRAVDDDAKAFFTDMLADIDAPTLPFGLTNTQNDGRAIVDYRQAVPMDIARRLRAEAQRRRMSPATLFHAAWAIVLAACSGRNQVVFGSVLSGRLQGTVGAEHMMGVFINTLPVRMDIDKRNPVDFVQSVHRQLTALLSYEQTSLALAQNCSGVVGEQPLFSALMNYRHTGSAQVEQEQRDINTHAQQQISGIEFIAGEVRNNYPLTMSIDDFGKQGFGLAGLFDSSIDAERLMAFMQSALLQLLEALETDNSLLSICSISVLSEQERQQLLTGHALTGNGDTLPGLVDTDAIELESIHAMFEAQAAVQPDATALICGEHRYSYEELNGQVNQLARYLRQQGVCADTPVALYMERSPLLVIALLATLKAGGCYVPLDTQWPASRRQKILSTAGIKILLSEQAWQDALLSESSPVSLCFVDSDQEKWSALSQVNPGYDVAGNDAAYVIYTSGSTGEPKGVVVEHAQLLNYVNALNARLNVAGMSFAHLSTVAADLGNTGLFGALCFGGCLQLIDAQTAFDADAVASVLKASPVDAMKIVPGHLRGLLAAQDAARLLPRKLLILGGETCPPALIRQLWQLSPELKIVNHYGPSEATVGVLTHEITRADLDAQSIPIGKPLANSNAYVLNAARQLCPAGVAGELYIGGANVARGYLNRPDLSAERFIANEFSNAANARLYRTGDRVKWTEGNGLLFLGRVDNQVKVRGYRVELADIQACFERQPQVQSAVVRLLQSELTAQLIAWVVPNPTDNSEAQTFEPKDAWRQDLADRVAEELPEYMLPQHIRVISDIPLTVNGKVDFTSLEQAFAATESRSERRQPTNDVERALLQAWQKVLHRDDFGIDDNFFSLGGDSILSLQLIPVLRRSGYKLTPKLLFDNPVIARLAKVATPVDKGQPTEAMVTGEVQLAPIQQWFFNNEHPCPEHWDQSFLVQVKQPLNRDALCSAVALLVKHHDQLRSEFTLTEQGPVQRVLEWREESGKEYYHLTLDIEQEFMPNTINQWLASLSFKAHSGVGQLFKVVHFSFDESNADFQHDQAGATEDNRKKHTERKEHLLLVAHHLLVDGVSWRIIMEDLQTAYQYYLQPAVIRPKTSPLPARTVSYQSWTKTQQNLVQQANANWQLQAREYWREKAQQIDKMRVLVQPAEHYRVADISNHQQLLDAQTTRALLQDAPAAYQTQINDLLLTALSIALAKQRADDALYIELEGHGREPLDTVNYADEADLSRTVGWFTSRFPVLLDYQQLNPATADADGLGSLIKQCKEQLRALPSQGASYGAMRYYGELPALPAPAITFNYLGQTQQQMQSDIFEGSPFSGGMVQRHPDSRATHLLTINAIVANEQLRVNWQSVTGQTQLNIQQLASDFNQAIAQILAHCGTERQGYTPSDFPLARLRQQQLDALVQDIGPTRLQDVYPITPMQQGLMLHSLLNPGTGIYCMQYRYQIKGIFDHDIFTRAWEQVVARHEVLRTSFIRHQDKALQVVHRQGRSPTEILDWREVPAAEQNDKLKTWMRERVLQSFDLAVPTQLGITLIRMEDERYQLIRSFHHILMDAWCFSLLMTDFMRFYKAAEAGETLVLPEPGRYRDYISWLDRQDEQQAETFWRETLAGFEAPTSLTIDSPQDTKGVKDHVTWLNSDETQWLQSLAQKHETTLNTLVQAAWGLLLSRYSGDDDVVFGVTVAGRPAEMEDADTIVGLFINSLPLRIKASREDRIEDYLKHILQMNQAMREFEFAPLADIQHWSDVPSGVAIFDSLFVYENAPVDRSLGKENKSSFELIDAANRTHTNYPLTVVVYPKTALGLQITFDRSRFEDADVARMLAHFRHLLINIGKALEAADAKPLQDIDMLSDAEQRQILCDWNQTYTDYPRHACWPELFLQQANATPDAIATVCGDDALRYADLRALSLALADDLRQRGVGANDVVAVLDQRGVNLHVMIVAVLLSGAAYLPLDPKHPKKRLATVLASSQAKLVLCSPSYGKLANAALAVNGSEVSSEVVDSEEVNSKERGDVNATQDMTNSNRCLTFNYKEARRTERKQLDVTCQTSDLAYVIYTSGSTGTPKGAMIEHLGMLNNVYAKIPNLSLSDADVIAQTASQCFDISVWQLLTGLICGARIHIYPDEVSHNPLALLEAIEDDAVTILESVPGLIHSFIDFAPPLTHLRWLMPTGEALTTELAKNWLQRYPDIPMINAYGPAECADDVAFWPVHSIAETQLPCIPIGKPTDNNRLYVLSATGQLQPVGVPGELYVAGAGVGRGYLNDERRTQEVFIDNFLRKLPQQPQQDNLDQPQRLYRTGDLARWRSDGVLEYLGRVDHQVKIRGYRIELGEIEACIEQSPGVALVAAVIKPDPRGDSSIVAYYQPTDDAAQRRQDESLYKEQEASIRAHIESVLPVYMMPTLLVPLEKMPLNNSGKIDRRALPAPEFAASSENITGPRNNIEQGLHHMWCEVLKLEQVDIFTGFFALGGHSLLAIRLHAKICQHFEVELSLRSLFERNSIADVAEQIELQLTANLLADEPVSPESTNVVIDEQVQTQEDFEEFEL